MSGEPYDDGEEPIEVVEVRLTGEIALDNGILPPELASVVVSIAGRSYVPAPPEAGQRDGSRSMRRAIQLVRELGRTPLVLVVHPAHRATALVVSIEESIGLELSSALPVGGPGAVRVRWEGTELQELPPAADTEDEPWRG
jgi:hypothetical protein